ncbi:MAG: IS1634 family transposase [Pirellulaceae bacterium]|nr:IS1634 family transposase [Pirellulaceae bacterium]
MFLRPYRRHKDGKTHTYYALVECVRTEAGPRQHVVAYLGELNHDQQRRWQRTLVFYNRQGEARQLRLFPDDERIPLPDDPDVVRIRLSSVGWTNPRRFGDVWLARWLWGWLHLDEIVARHVPQGRETVAPADIVTIEVINRLCGPCSEFALAEHWYTSTGLEDLLGVPDAEVTKDRLYRTLDDLVKAQEPIENELKERLGNLFRLEYDLLLYDLTSTYFEGLAEANELAQRGYSRDHRSDGVQVVVALVVTREGFPLAHLTLPGNTRDLQTVERVVTAVEKRFGKSQRVWVMDRGMISKQTLAFLSQPGRRYLLALRRSGLSDFQDQLGREGWQRMEAHAEVEVKLVPREETTYLLSRSRPRRKKERAIRRRQRRGLAGALQRLQRQVASGRLKMRDKILERVGRLKERFPKARPFVTITVSDSPCRVQWTWDIPKFKAALAGDGVSLMRTNQDGWTPTEFWETYMQLTVVENAFRVLKSHLLLRPVWHHYAGRTKAHIFICVLAYTLWSVLAELARRAGLMTLIRKPDPESESASPAPRPMTPEVILRELGQIKIGDILLETTDGQKLTLRRVARPNPEQLRILTALNLEIPERLTADSICSEDSEPKN